jgi:Carboxylesterase family
LNQCPHRTLVAMLFSGLLTLACALTANAQSNGLTVSTQQGAVVGTLVSPTVRRFLGIPYAVAGRWAAPTSPPNRAATFSATSFSDSCLQALTPGALEFLKLAGLQNTTVPESEACLSANIWTQSVSRKQATAVLLWVYGGGFSFGTVCSSRFILCKLFISFRRVTFLFMMDNTSYETTMTCWL